MALCYNKELPYIAFLVFLFSGGGGAERAFAKSFVVGSQSMLEYSIQLDAKIKPEYILEVTSPSNGEVNSQCTPYGTNVEVDQNLFSLSTPELDANFYQIKSQLLDQIRYYKEIKDWGNSLAVLQANSNVQKSHSNLNFFNEKYLQSQILFSEGILSKQECLQDKKQYEQAEDLYQNAVQIKNDVLKKGSKKQLQIQKLKVLNLKKQFEIIEKKIKSKDIKAPASGKFVRPYLPSQQKNWHLTHTPFSCQEGEVLGLIMSNSFEVVAFFQPEQELSIKYDMPVTLHLKNDLEAFFGNIKEISSPLDFNKKNKIDTEVVVGITKISDELKERLQPSQSVTMEFKQSILSKYPLIPISMITVSEHKIYTYRNNSSEKVEITLGKSDHHYIEVLTGLIHGDIIYAPG